MVLVVVLNYSHASNDWGSTYGSPNELHTQLSNIEPTYKKKLCSHAFVHVCVGGGGGDSHMCQVTALLP